jgi:hypothetical protein
MRVINRMAAFDALQFGGVIEPGGWMPTCDYVDIMRAEFSDVRTPVFFGNSYARQAGYPNQQSHRQAITACGSQWYIPQAELVPGCRYAPPLYMEADSAYGPRGPLYARDVTGGGYLMRDVWIDSTSTVCDSGSAIYDKVQK